MPNDAPSRYLTQTPFSDPGPHADLLEEIPATIADIAAAVHPLFFHYRADGDWDEHGVPADHIADINTRYVSDMLDLLLDRDADLRNPDRIPASRMVGCCRDWALMTVAICRARGIPARMRVGFAGYFVPGWWMDHVVAEVWDGERWRLVDSELGADHRDADTGQPIPRTDVPYDRFLIAPDAWQAARDGRINPERFVVAPEIPLPFLKSWPYLRHNLMLDLASLNGYELLLWDDWGIDEGDSVPDDQLPLLDTVAAASTDAEREDLFARDEFRVPPVIHSSDPTDGDGEMVTLRTA